MRSDFRHVALAVATLVAAATVFAQGAAQAPQPSPAPAPAPAATTATPPPETPKAGVAAPTPPKPGAGKSSGGSAGTRSGGLPGGLTIPSSADTGKGSAGGRPPGGRPGKEQQKRVNLQSVYAEVMTDAEKAAFREKVRKVKTYDECKALMEATHQTMEPRAKTQGKSLPQTPVEACDKAKERGRVTG